MHEPDPIERLNVRLFDTDDVYVNAGTDKDSYFAELRAGINQYLCTPFHVSAVVTEPGFPDLSVGASISGWCMAHSAGYWFVYQSERDRSLCFWGNKAAILFRLQSDEWRQTTELLRGILVDAQRPPLERLRRLVHAFLRSECEEAAMRVALDDAAPFYRDAAEAREARAAGDRIVEMFMREALPKASDAARALAGGLVGTALSTVGKQFSESPRTPAEIAAYADAMADMFCAYLEGIGKTRNKVPRPSRPAPGRGSSSMA